MTGGAFAADASDGVPPKCRYRAVVALATTLPRITPREPPMSELPSHVQGYRETMRARENDRASRAAEIRRSIEEERRVVDQRTARLRAMRLAKVTKAG